MTLKAEKLIATSAAGTIVLGITKYDVEDMFFVKKQLEPFAFRLAAENITDEEAREYIALVFENTDLTERLQDLIDQL